MSDQAVQNIHGADKEIWREKTDDHYSPSIHVTGDEKIGIAVNGHVIQKPVRWWHSAGMAELEWTKLNEDDPNWESITVTISKEQQIEIRQYFQKHEQMYPNSHAAQTTDTMMILLEMLKIKIKGIN